MAPLDDAAALTVVLPAHDPTAALRAVAALADGWHDGDRLVLAGPVDARARRLLGGVEGDVTVVEVPSPVGDDLGECVLAAVAGTEGPVLVLDPRALPAAEDLALALARRPADDTAALLTDAAVLRDTPAAGAARSLVALRALVRAQERLAVPSVSAPREPHLAVATGVPGRVSVVIPVLDQPELTARCLDSLQRHGYRDLEVVVVDNGSGPATRRMLAARKGLTLLRNESNLGFAAGTNQGIQASTGEYVVLLNNDTQVTRFWAEGLLRAFATDPGVVAVGPRSNRVSGPQQVPGARYRTTAEMRAFAEDWRRRHRDSVRPATRLVGFALAVRRSALAVTGLLDEAYGTGGFEDDDLGLRLQAAGGRLVVADEVFVHHEGSATFRATRAWQGAYTAALAHHTAKYGRDVAFGEGSGRLLSACLIVKDEQSALPACLDSLTGVVDEIVVCDTGSSDRTVEIATAFGARVTRFPWVGDFAAARNAALAACTGFWVLTIDADETLECADPVGLREEITCCGAEALGVSIRSLNPDGSAADYSHEAERIFLRDECTYVGAVHETLVRKVDGSKPVLGRVRGAVLHHAGYVAEVFEAKDKAARNLALAEADFAEVAGEPGHPRYWKAVFELARVVSISDAPRARELFALALTAMPDQVGHFRSMAERMLSAYALAEGEVAAAVVHARAAVAADPAAPQAVLALAEALARDGREDEALALLRRPRDGESMSTDLAASEVLIPQATALLLHRRGDHAEATAVLVELLRSTPERFTGWHLLASTLRAGRGEQWAADLARLAASDPARALDQLDRIEPELLQELQAALRDLGVDVVAADPTRRRAAQVDDALAGHTPDVLARAARAAEDDDPAMALEIWRRVPASAARSVGTARCLVALDRVTEAAEALDDLDVDALAPADRVFVAALAMELGDADTAHGLLVGLRDADPALAQEARALAGLIGPRTESALERVLTPRLRSPPSRSPSVNVTRRGDLRNGSPGRYMGCQARMPDGQQFPYGGDHHVPAREHQHRRDERVPPAQQHRGLAQQVPREALLGLPDQPGRRRRRRPGQQREPAFPGRWPQGRQPQRAGRHLRRADR